MTYPESISLIKYVSHLPTQEQTSCCTACATLLSIEITLASKDIRINFSKLYLYYMTRKFQGRTGMKGAALKDTLETLKIHGASPETFWPFSFTRVNIEPSQRAIEEAAHYRLTSYSSITSDEYKEYLNKNIPIIVGLRTGKKFWSLKGQLNTHNYTPINLIDNFQSTGHAVTVVGYDDKLNGGSWIIANSTGPSWGHCGYAAIPYSCNIDIGESYVVTDFVTKMTG